MSIPKDGKGSMILSDNYKGICLCSSILKLIEIIMLNKRGAKLKPQIYSLHIKLECQLQCVQQCLRKLYSTISQMAVLFMVVYSMYLKLLIG